MNPEAGDSARMPQDQDTGLPIRMLIDQELEPSPDFIGRVRRKIHRRTAASQFASYSWHLPRVVLMEMVGVIGHFFEAFGARKEPKL